MRTPAIRSGYSADLPNSRLRVFVDSELGHDPLMNDTNPLQNLKELEVLKTVGTGGRDARVLGVSSIEYQTIGGDWSPGALIYRSLLMREARSIFGNALGSFELSAPKLKKFKTKK